MFWMFAHVNARSYKPATSNVFNVLSYGAVGDGHIDDSQAFLMAWSAASQSQKEKPTVVIPGGRTYFLPPIAFAGLCKSANILVKVDGNIVAPESPNAWNQLDVMTAYLLEISLMTFTSMTLSNRLALGGNGYAKDFYFKNLNFDTVSNPIIIDQYYCAVAGACPPQNVTYEHFTGTSATQAAVVLNCSQAVPCTELTFNSIQLSPAKQGETVKSVCINAHGERAGLLQPNIPCLLN
ncbi:probable polygalacturonase At3g15720 [Papaver somniferum]|uniref:probable polygalacturonase At3g15720 n=1 Tax=Papaver somniferum TaxID=3469 RepID=UPI000E705F7B|nr:probable polygalacturonase At3g15720 [Papaver somniferum]